MGTSIESIDAFLTSGSLTGLIIGVSLLIRYLWKVYWSDKIGRKKNTAEVNIIQTMTEQITRLNTEIQQVKALYSKEIEELKIAHQTDLDLLRDTHNSERLSMEDKLNKLEKKFEEMRDKNEKMKAEALEAYTYLSNSEGCDEEMLKNLRDKLLSLVFNQSG